jgi:hypothetical protein
MDWNLEVSLDANVPDEYQKFLTGLTSVKVTVANEDIFGGANTTIAVDAFDFPDCDAQATLQSHLFDHFLSFIHSFTTAGTQAIGQLGGHNIDVLGMSSSMDDYVDPAAFDWDAPLHAL